ncbi:MAG: dephospho-CoA kinase [Methylococcaceae bacterium]|jgi:dephospho-CoA kinase
MLNVGLTGGIGCGKSTVANLFAARGVAVVDADEIARILVEPGQPALSAIVDHFGPDVITHGRLDRAVLRQRIFSVPTDRRWLESLLHPLIYRRMQAEAQALGGSYCLMVVPLLLESGGRAMVDRVLVVDCAADLQRRRVKSRDNLDDAAFDRIIAAQLGRNARLAAADDIIVNDGTPESLSVQVDRLHLTYLSLSQS